MRITCPNCQFQGLIDIAPLASETPVACVRCGTTFAAFLVEGEILTSLLPNPEETMAEQADASAAEESPVTADTAQLETALPVEEVIANDAVLASEDVLALPQALDASYQESEQAPVLEDVLPLVEVESPAQAAAFEQPVLEAVKVSVVADESAALDEAAFGSMDEDETESPEIERERSSEPVRSLPAPPAEVQGVGMRLMRISPLWLIICGLTFVSVIILSNRFAKTAGQGPLVAMNHTATSNRATNQSDAQQVAPTLVNSNATSATEASQPTAPAVSEAKVESSAMETKAGAQDELKALAEPSVVPVVETKHEPVISAPRTQPEGVGNLTIQVGSYNVIEQANERVARLQAAGFDARIEAVELPKRGTWYRVQAGRFKSREEAARYGNEMKAEGAADNFIIAEVGK